MCKEQYACQDNIRVLFIISISHISLHDCMTGCTASHIHTPTPTLTYTHYTCIHTYTHIHIHTHIHVHTYIHIHTYTYKHTHIHRHAYSYTYTMHIHIHIHRHAYTNHVTPSNNEMYLYDPRIPAGEVRSRAQKLVQWP